MLAFKKCHRVDLVFRLAGFDYQHKDRLIITENVKLFFVPVFTAMIIIFLFYLSHSQQDIPFQCFSLPQYNHLMKMNIISKLGALRYLSFSILQKQRENNFLRYVTIYLLNLYKLCHFHLILPKNHFSGKEMGFSFTILVLLQAVRLVTMDENVHCSG